MYLLEMKISKLEDILAGARVLDTENIDLSKVGVLTKVKLKNVNVTHLQLDATRSQLTTL